MSNEVNKLFFFGVHEENPRQFRPFIHLHVEDECIEFVCDTTFDNESMAKRFTEVAARLLCETKKNEIDLKGPPAYEKH